MSQADQKVRVCVDCGNPGADNECPGCGDPFHLGCLATNPDHMCGDCRAAGFVECIGCGVVAAPPFYGTGWGYCDNCCCQACVDREAG